MTLNEAQAMVTSAAEALALSRRSQEEDHRKMAQACDLAVMDILRTVTASAKQGREFTPYSINTQTQHSKLVKQALEKLGFEVRVLSSGAFSVEWKSVQVQARSKC